MYDLVNIDLNELLENKEASPTSVEDTLKKQLTDCGLWPSEADAIIAEAKQECRGMDGVWHQPMSGYPMAFQVVSWMTIRFQARKWLEENKPRHFALAMFAD